jgi:hypothetical protein
MTPNYFNEANGDFRYSISALLTGDSEGSALGVHRNFTFSVPPTPVPTPTPTTDPNTTPTPTSPYSQSDLDYIEAFNEVFTLQDPPLDYNYYATTGSVARFTGSTLTQYIALMRDDEYLPFNFGAWMEGFNTMYLETESLLYVRENIRLIRAILNHRDDVRGIPLFDGNIEPVWGTDLYSSFGREYFAVDDGSVVYPMLEFLEIARNHPAAMAELEEGEFDSMLSMINETLEFHAAQYVQGPGPDEGHFVFLRTDLAGFTGEPQPVNWMSSIGRAYWLSWKLSGNTVSRDIALGFANYAKNRISLATDGAYYWGYWLPIEAVDQEPVPRHTIRGLPGYDWIEDISHAALTASFWIQMASEGEVFNSTDMQRLTRTVRLGFARLGEGVMFPDIIGNPLVSLINRVPSMTYFMNLTPYDFEVYERMSEFYYNYWPSPGPLEGALIFKYGASGGGPAATPTSTVTLTVTRSATPPSPSPTATPTSISTGTATPDNTATLTPTVTQEPTPSSTPTESQTAMNTATTTPVPDLNPYFEFALRWFQAGAAADTGELLQMIHTEKHPEP